MQVVCAKKIILYASILSMYAVLCSCSGYIQHKYINEYIVDEERNEVDKKKLKRLDQIIKETESMGVDILEEKNCIILVINERYVFQGNSSVIKPYARNIFETINKIRNLFEIENLSIQVYRYISDTHERDIEKRIAIEQSIYISKFLTNMHVDIPLISAYGYISNNQETFQKNNTILIKMFLYKDIELNT